MPLVEYISSRNASPAVGKFALDDFWAGPGQLNAIPNQRIAITL
jgi:hypothetical protein